MRVFYGLIITAVILMIGACALKAYKKEGALARVVFLYELGAFMCGIIFLVYTYVPGTTITVLCKGLIMASFDCLLVLLMYYTQYYTGMFKGIVGVKVFMIAYSLFETVAFLMNAWTRWIFDITDISGDQIIVQFAKGNVLGRLHYVFAYGIMLLLILSYIVMVERMSRFYRFRYFAILILLFAAFLLDIMTTWSDSIYDMSMVVFGIMSVLIYYLTYSYVPNELIENTFSLIIRDMNSGIICFDNAGRCIYCNGIVKEMYSITDNINEVEHNYASWLQTQTEHDNKKFRQTISEGKERRSFDISYNRVYDDKHNFICDYFIFNDRTEAVELLEYEKFRATHDNLTGLLNKEQFYEETANVVRNDRNHKYCLVCSNIKDFKLVNELFGIEKGDEIIKMQAGLIKASSESGYICGRIQNDRFAVCMPKDSFKNEIMQNSIVSMQDRFNNASFKIRVVVGVYDIEDVDEPVSNMCDKAFIASETIMGIAGSGEACAHGQTQLERVGEADPLFQIRIEHHVEVGDGLRARIGFVCGLERFQRMVQLLDEGAVDGLLRVVGQAARHFAEGGVGQWTVDVGHTVHGLHLDHLSQREDHRCGIDLLAQDVP